MTRRVLGRLRRVRDADEAAGTRAADAGDTVVAPVSAGGGGHPELPSVPGPHRIFLGYAPGVGKTYAMLIEARLRAGRGEDVVIGWLGPHVRRETKALGSPLECVPPGKIAYRGSVFAELDTAGVIARSPAWVVVDELAHTSIPGAGSEKRWESVDEILKAGIGVLSTLNVQHICGLNDYIYQVTGVRVAETVPDSMIDAAELVIVDVEPDELLARLRGGHILPPGEVGQALTHFFRRPSLVALRELTLQIGRDGLEGPVGSGGHGWAHTRYPVP